MSPADECTKIVILSAGELRPEGHELHYTRLLLEAAAASGWSAEVVSLAASKAKSPARGIAGRLQRRLEHEILQLRDVRSLAATILHYGGPDVRFILHTADYETIGRVARGFMIASRRRVVGRLSIVLRYDHYDDAGAMTFIRSALATARHAPIDYFSDSEELRLLMSPLAPTPVGLAPPPTTFSPLAGPRERLIGYFGGRRSIKGYDRLPDLIRALRARCPDVRAVIQSYAHPHDGENPKCDAALAQLRTMDGVECVERPLEADDYKRLLSACAMVLLPYDRLHYRAGTSGVFVEATSVGATVAVTAETWMAREALRVPLGRVIDCAWNLDGALTDALVAAMEEGRRQWRPSEQEKRWMDQHRPRVILRTLLGRAYGEE